LNPGILESSSHSKYDLLSVDLGWSIGKSGGQDIKRAALSFLNLKRREIFCTYKPHLGFNEFLTRMENLKDKSSVLLDIPIKGKAVGFFRPAERIMQRTGIPCRPSKNALARGKKLSSEIEPLGFKTLEIYPFEYYKFLSVISVERPDIKKGIHIDSGTFRRFFPPYKRTGEEGLKSADKIIKKFLKLLNLNLINDRNLALKNQNTKWDIFDSLFGAIAGYLWLKQSPWVKVVKDKTGSEILLLVDKNLGDFFENVRF
jgi:hypothetical protein